MNIKVCAFYEIRLFNVLAAYTLYCNSMNIHEYIIRYHAKRKHVIELKEKCIELYAMATEPHAGINTDGITLHSSYNSRENLLVKLADRKEAYTMAKLDYLQMRQKLFDYVQQLQDPNEADAVYYHVVEDMKEDECIKTMQKGNGGKELCRTTFYRYLYRGIAHMKELYNEQNGGE